MSLWGLCPYLWWWQTWNFFFSLFLVTMCSSTVTDALCTYFKSKIKSAQAQGLQRIKNLKWEPQYSQIIKKSHSRRARTEDAKLCPESSEPLSHACREAAPTPFCLLILCSCPASSGRLGTYVAASHVLTSPHSKSLLFFPGSPFHCLSAACIPECVGWDTCLAVA